LAGRKVEEDNGLTEKENAELAQLNIASKLDNQERSRKAVLRDKKQKFKAKQLLESVQNGEEVKLGDTLEELVWITSIISKALAPQIFKDRSAANLTLEEIKLMHTKAELLNQKING